MKKARGTKHHKAVPDPQFMRQNTILDGLDQRTLEETSARCSVSTLKLREKIYVPEEIIRVVHFPIQCVLSVVSHMQDGSQIEIGTIGREGMSAFPLLMGASSTANDSYCQVPGTAITMSAEVFRGLCSTSETFRQRLDRYLQAYVNMLGQLAACNRLHSVHQRCARWLLLTHDRVNSDKIPLTHEYLAMMLGTDRSGVSVAASAFQQAGFIRYAYGAITILDRSGLENAACECYKVARLQFEGLVRNIDNQHDNVLKKVP